MVVVEAASPQGAVVEGRQVSSIEGAVDGLEVARELIPARVRRWLYAAASLAGVALTAAVVGFTTAAVAVPDWVTITLAVLGALMGPLGMLAATNTPRVEPLPDPAEGVADGTLG